MPEREAEHLAPLVERVHGHVRPGRTLHPPARVTFYPYVDAKSIVREREGRIHLRLSDQLAAAPDQVLEGVVGILLARYFGLPDARADPAAVRAYREYLNGHAAGAAGRRQARGRKHIDPVGRHRSLLEAYLRVALDMDLALPQVPRLSWSKTVAGHRFGHWDPDHNVVVISQILDDPEVPEFVLDYVLWHELLHIVHPVRMGSGTKRIVHGAAFRRDERRFPRWKEGEEWIGKLARKSRRRRR
ncbi:MAG: hypothetical protein ABR562_00845 [Thermoplasmatota archaeon]|nr:hypothetical protein [Halobacteriales archaeon]